MKSVRSCVRYSIYFRVRLTCFVPTKRTFTEMLPEARSSFTLSRSPSCTACFHSMTSAVAICAGLLADA